PQEEQVERHGDGERDHYPTPGHGSSSQPGARPSASSKSLQSSPWTSSSSLGVSSEAVSRAALSADPSVANSALAGASLMALIAAPEPESPSNTGTMPLPTIRPKPAAAPQARSGASGLPKGHHAAQPCGCRAGSAAMRALSAALGNTSGGASSTPA